MNLGPRWGQYLILACTLWIPHKFRFSWLFCVIDVCMNPKKWYSLESEIFTYYVPPLLEAYYWNIEIISFGTSLWLLINFTMSQRHQCVQYKNHFCVLEDLLLCKPVEMTCTKCNLSCEIDSQESGSNLFYIRVGNRRTYSPLAIPLNTQNSLTHFNNNTVYLKLNCRRLFSG